MKDTRVINRDLETDGTDMDSFADFVFTVMKLQFPEVRYTLVMIDRGKAEKTGDGYITAPAMKIGNMENEEISDVISRMIEREEADNSGFDVHYT